MRRIIDYDKNEVKVTNLEALPAGTGAKYLVAIESPYPGEYVAKAWKHKMPASTGRGEVVIRF